MFIFNFVCCNKCVFPKGPSEISSLHEQRRRPRTVINGGIFRFRRLDGDPFWKMGRFGTKLRPRHIV